MRVCVCIARRENKLTLLVVELKRLTRLPSKLGDGAYRSAIAHANTTALRLFDQGRDESGTALLHPVQRCVDNNISPLIERSEPHLRTFKNDLWNDDWELDKTNPLVKQRAAGKLRPGDVVFTTFPCNVGFDYCALFKTTDGDVHLLLVECKSGNDRSVVKPSDLTLKVANLKQKLAVALAPGSKHQFALAGIKSSRQVTLLFNVLREPQANKENAVDQIEAAASESPAFEGSVLLMDKRDVTQFLGPTFAPLHWLADASD
jgi:hypothetical protein